jgi:hypothetical protein
MSHTFAEKEDMYKKDQYCHWCKRKMTLYYCKDITPFWKTPDDAATFDHIYVKKSNQRNWYQSKHISSPVILACFKCNHDRANKDYDSYLQSTEKRLQKEREYNKKRNLEINGILKTINNI